MVKEKSIWQIVDGKRGHENQSGGLIRAISKYLPVKTQRLEIDQNRASWWQAFKGKFPLDRFSEQPDLIIAAGSQTHATLLAAGRATGAPTILLMSPPKPLTPFYSLCIIPEHDGHHGPNVINTKGALNLVNATGEKEPLSGLLLIGGPSQHHDWDEAALLEPISNILAANPEMLWTLTTSRRTPPATTERLEGAFSDQLKMMPAEITEASWLPAQLAKASCVWVTEDSVSMVYEALTSGAKVGLLPVPRKKQNSRIIHGLDSLISEAYLFYYSDQQADLAKRPNPPPLNEADRIAKIIIERYF